MNWLITGIDEQFHGDELLQVCDKCGRELVRKVYTVVEKETGKTYQVGSGCVLTLTGQSVGVLLGEKRERESLAAREREEEMFVIRHKEFVEANTEAVELIHEKATEQKARWDRFGQEPFFVSLERQIERRGTLSEKQMVVVNRILEQRKATDGIELPEKGDKVTEIGIVKSYQIQEFACGRYCSSSTFQFNVELKNKVMVYVKVGCESKTGIVLADFVNAETVKNEQIVISYEDIIEYFVGKKVMFNGKVNWVGSKDGRYSVNFVKKFEIVS